MADKPDPGAAAGAATGGLPTEALKRELRELLKVLGQRAVGSVTSRVTAAGGKIGQKAAGQVAGQAKQLTERIAGGGGDGGGKGGGQGKLTNIVEQIDVGVPVRVAYDQWTRFTDFPGFMKKVEDVQQVSDTELKWRGRILWSHRDWKSTINDQVPDQRIVWRSEGSKGYVDGAVTFHELSPELTRILLVLEYHPAGFLEKTGNLWRAQGRRARLELKHFRRHVMTQTMLHPEELEGWRGEVHDAEVQQPPEDESGEQQSEKQASDEQASDEQASDEQASGEQASGEQASGEQESGEKAATGGKRGR